MTDGNAAQEDSRQPKLSGGDTAQVDNGSLKNPAPATAESGEEADLAGAWLLEDAPGVGGNIAPIAAEVSTPGLASGGDVAPIAEYAESMINPEEGCQAESAAGAKSANGNVSAELDDWSPEVDDEPRDSSIAPGQGGAEPAAVEHEP